MVLKKLFRSVNTHKKVVVLTPHRYDSADLCVKHGDVLNFSEIGRGISRKLADLQLGLSYIIR